jgi:hypothetical protein
MKRRRLIYAMTKEKGRAMCEDERKSPSVVGDERDIGKSNLERKCRSTERDVRSLGLMSWV